MNESACIVWQEDGHERRARWRSEAGLAAPKRIIIADDTITADQAHRLASEGNGILWRGDYQNARQLLQAMTRRLERKPRKTSDDPATAFNLHRQALGQRARILGMLLIPFNADYGIPLRRAPDVRSACTQAWGTPSSESSPDKVSERVPGGVPDGVPNFAPELAPDVSVASLRELLGLIGAHEWHKKGIALPALGARIFPSYGVFSPVRGEYLDLISAAPLPAALASNSLAFDIGTGTGVLAAILARRGVAKVLATDCDARALNCAAANFRLLGLDGKIELREADLFPSGRAPLIVCNPPWVPARPSSPIEAAVFDPDSRMLRGFLNGLKQHLTADGEAWLILSDLAEHLGLRSRETLLAMIAEAGLSVVARADVRPRHPKVHDVEDALHRARSAEVTSLWRLRL